jgi:hypothetical protein
MRSVVCFLAMMAACAQAPSTPQKLDENARLEQVIQWAAKARPADCAALTSVLLDDSFDLRNRAASALYWKCDRAKAINFGTSLCRSLELGNAEAGAVLLLGYARPEVAKPCLRTMAKRPEMVKLEVSAQPVSISLAATVALARLGDAEAQHQLRQAFDKPTQTTALFLLGVLRDIDDHEALQAAVKLLDDDREAPGVMSDSTRTIRDVALEALVARLSLTTSFAVEPGRLYDPQQISEVRTAAERALSEPSKTP